MKKTVVFLLTLFLTGSFYSFAENEIGPEYGKILNVTFSGDISQNPDYKKPAWSPDGKWIAFIAANDTSIYIAPANGGEAILVYTKSENFIINKYSYKISEIGFTPDSQKIVFVSDVIDTKFGGQFIYIDTDVFQTKNNISYIQSIDIYSGEYSMLVRGGFNPSWSHDGRYMAYVKFDENTWLSENLIEHNGSPAIYDTVTKETRYLTDYTIPDLSSLQGYFEYNMYEYPAISPDNNFVYISMKISGVENIARIPFEGGNPEVLTSFINKDTFCNNLKFSPESKWLSFDTWVEILVYNISTGKIYDYFNGKEFVEKSFVRPEGFELFTSNLCWAPDGINICYNMYIYDSNSPVMTTNKIYITSFNPEKYSGNYTYTDSETPADFSIIGNYPNPFNPSTTISFSIPSGENVRLNIYNSSGQKVRELLSGFIGAGNHSVLWNGCDDKGNRVSSGLYFPRMEYKGKNISKKMLMIK